jgi:cell division septum initiation protein DivIVA
MSLRGTLDAIAATLEQATSVPLSASCVLNRAGLLALVEQARGELPQEIVQASGVLAEREEVLADAAQQAEQVLAAAQLRARELVEQDPVVQRARHRAEQILDAAGIEAQRLLRGADDYCDRRLAELELDLDRVAAQVRRGRDGLRERREDPRQPEPPQPDRVIDLTVVEQPEPSVVGLGSGRDLQ